VNPQTPNQVDLDSLLAHTHDGVFAVDRERRLVLFNKGCEALTGYSAEEILGPMCRCSDVTHCHDEQGRSLAGRLCPGLTILRGEAPASRQKICLTTKAGQERWVETIYTTLYGADGQPECIIGVMRDISEAQEREEGWRQTNQSLQCELERVRGQMQAQYAFEGIISRSEAMKAVLDKARAACTNSSPILVTGENGTGKELVARTIHFNSQQKDGPFIPVSCFGASRDTIEAELFGSVRPAGEPESPGLFCAADGGTLFLDDVDCLPQGTQAKLLRAIQDRRVRPVGGVEHRPANPRVIAATRRPADMLRDLHYLLSVVPIEVPPLRSRKDDIPLIVQHLLVELGRQSGRQISEIDPEVWRLLVAHDWPGNIRELHNVVESTFVTGSGPVLRAEEFKLNTLASAGAAAMCTPTSPLLLDETLADVERRAILSALQRAVGQRSRAAKLMGISRSRLYRRMEALGILNHNGNSH
jgi:PAS domain S-box-containing protein